MTGIFRLTSISALKDKKVFAEFMSATTLIVATNEQITRYTKGHPNLVEVIFEDNILKIHEDTFEGCVFLKKVRFPKTPIIIDTNAFSNCGFVDITIPSTITFNGDMAFDGCLDLKKVTIENGVRSIANGTFVNCMSLEEVIFPTTEIKIGMFAFSRCGFVEITLPSNVILGPKVFHDSPKLEKVIIMDNVERIPQMTFSASPLLKTVEFPKTVIIIDDMAFSGGGFVLLPIPGTVILNGKRIFSNCFKLLDVVIGEGVTNIPLLTFYGCKLLESIAIPMSVTNINPNAFTDRNMAPRNFAQCDIKVLYSQNPYAIGIMRSLFPDISVQSIEEVKDHVHSDTVFHGVLADMINSLVFDTNPPEKEKEKEEDQSGGYILTKKKYLKLVHIEHS